MKRLLTFVLLTAAFSCNKSSDNGFWSTAEPILPAAIAGDDQDVLVGALVTLNGSKSFDPTGATIAYQWSQTSGPAVTLSDATVASPTFTAPALASPPTPDVLTFALTVSSTNGTDIANVSINVKSMLVKRPVTEPWFVGYGNSGVITPTVSGGTGPFTYEWTGLENWLTVTGGTASATLSWTTPSLADLQNFPDRADVAVMQRTAQGRLQLKVKVTDAAGAVDEDFVNFSAGPFADTVAHENVALGEPVFLNGGETTTAGAITSWAWSGIKPTGAAISFFRPTKAALAGATTQRFVYFVPDQLGLYEIILTQNPGAVVKVINVNAAKYVGVGNLLGKTPDPFIGECAACHAGQLGFIADFANTWKETGHATMYSRLLDPANSYHAALEAKGSFKDGFNFGSNYSIDSRNAGWSTITATASDGWVQHANAEGYVLKDTTWDAMKRRHPKTAARSNVQCESCHGPGSEHAGDTTGIRKSFDSINCGRCHSKKQDQWEAGSHGRPPIAYPSGSGSCNGCHTAQGFVVEMRAQEGADPHVALFSVSNLNRPVIPLEDRRGTSCQACHDPHKRTAKLGSTGSDSQLRAYGNVQFKNGAVAWAGVAATCYTCHTARRDSTPGSGDMAGRSAPHDSTAAEMLAGTNAHQFAGWTYANSPHGIPARFVKSGQTEPARQCVACHIDVAPAAGTPGYGALGGHTFAVTQGAGPLGLLANQTTHPGAATVAASKKFTVAAGASAFTKRVAAGDTVTIAAGADVGTYTVATVDSAVQLTLVAGANFTGGAVTSYTIVRILAQDTTHPGAATVAGTKRFTVASGTTLLKRAYPGDTLVITAGADTGSYTVSSVDSARQLTLTGGAATFTGGAVTGWTLRSEKKYNVAACTQCHTTAIDFEDAARADYDGDGSVESVQNEIAGLEAALTAAINVKLVAYTGVAGTVLATTSKVRYDKGGTGTSRVFPGPGVTGSDNPDIAWSSLTAIQQAEWETLFRVAYNLAFVKNDHSEGIHNTGYAVNLLQSGYKEVTGTTIGAPFTPFP